MVIVVTGDGGTANGGGEGKEEEEETSERGEHRWSRGCAQGAMNGQTVTF